jgi:hypothetical protein
MRKTSFLCLQEEKGGSMDKFQKETANTYLLLFEPFSANLFDFIVTFFV